MTITNKYPGKCHCGAAVASAAGTATKSASGKWEVLCAAHSTGAVATPARSSSSRPARTHRTTCVGCGGHLDAFQIRRGFKFCSTDCVNDRRLGGQSGYVGGVWHQGIDD